MGLNECPFCEGVYINYGDDNNLITESGLLEYGFKKEWFDADARWIYARDGFVPLAKRTYTKWCYNWMWNSKQNDIKTYFELRHGFYVQDKSILNKIK